MTNHTLFYSLIAALSAGVVAVGFGQHNHQAGPQPPLQIPSSLKAEHEELHQELSAATKMPGRTGEAARRVASLLHPHFVKEEEVALPPLGLLLPLARGTASREMVEAVALTDRLKAELPRMLDEHKAVVAALEELAAAGKAENRPEAVQFAHKLKVHAETEEQVLYPAALLVGEYLKLRFRTT